ncbi:MAG: MBL fold metallo-hydrolase [Coriobacteriales bacterium]|jgi:glyoxylase-like metal-dependent hydrolase (beta-lactamase superfamily II)|nr:MBL fold metallo-hydrolase [Coriobacteriales bacterium]
MNFNDKALQIETVILTVGNQSGFTTNCYLLKGPGVTNQVWVVDPADDWPKLQSALQGLAVKGAICTHRHYDHIGALAALLAVNPVSVIVGRMDAEPIIVSWEIQSAGQPEPPAAWPIKEVDDGDCLDIGGCSVEVLHTPGHSAGSICLYDHSGQQLISGDTLFFRAHGRTDLPTGDAHEMLASLRRLAKLPAETIVYPGHGPTTSIESECLFGILQPFC